MSRFIQIIIIVIVITIIIIIIIIIIIFPKSAHDYGVAFSVFNKCCFDFRYPFTPDQPVQEADWEIYLRDTAAQIVEQQSPKRYNITDILYSFLYFKEPRSPTCIQLNPGNLNYHGKLKLLRVIRFEEKDQKHLIKEVLCLYMFNCKISSIVRA